MTISELKKILNDFNDDADDIEVMVHVLYEDTNHLASISIRELIIYDSKADIIPTVELQLPVTDKITDVVPLSQYQDLEQKFTEMKARIAKLIEK